MQSMPEIPGIIKSIRMTFRAGLGHGFDGLLATRTNAKASEFRIGIDPAGPTFPETPFIINQRHPVRHFAGGLGRQD